LSATAEEPYNYHFPSNHLFNPLSPKLTLLMGSVCQPWIFYPSSALFDVGHQVSTFKETGAPDVSANGLLRPSIKSISKVHHACGGHLYRTICGLYE
jgi:hypothetical protein